MQTAMNRAAQRWDDLPIRDRAQYSVARQQHIEQRTSLIAEARAALQVRIASLQAEADRELQSQGLPNLVSAAEKFTNEELEDLAATLRTSGADPGVSTDASATAPQEPSVAEMNELERLQAELDPQGPDVPEQPWWVRHIAPNRDEWYACGIFDEEAEDEKLYLMLFASQQPRSVWFLECREKARIIQAGAAEHEDSDVPAAYREFEFLEPLVLLPDHRLPLTEDSNIGVYSGTVFRGPLLCTYHEPVSFEDFMKHLPATTATEPRRKAGPRPRPHDAVDRLLQEHDWLTREDFADDVVRRPPRTRKGGRTATRARKRTSDSDSGDALRATS
eukprot:1539778-Heterocapsa_arctica.AAC.1